MNVDFPVGENFLRKKHNSGADLTVSDRGGRRGASTKQD
jgi:hypothetical protein